MPVREIPMKHSSIAGKRVSKKNKRLISSESSLEGDFITLLEFNPKVLFYEEQPEAISYVDATGKTRTYTPDFLVTYNADLCDSGPILCEIKYKQELIDRQQELSVKFGHAKKYAAERGWKFMIYTEEDIRNDYLYNIKFLSRFKSNSISTSMTDQLITLINRFGTTTPAEVVAAAAKSDTLKAHYLYNLWYLIANFRVKCDLNKKLSMRTTISL